MRKMFAASVLFPLTESTTAQGQALPSWMRLAGGMIRLLAAACSLAVVFRAATVCAREISLNEAVAIAVENNPDLAAVAQELVVAQSEVERANYVSQFNPELLSEGDYRDRAGHSNSQEWRARLSQQLEIFGQPALRRRSAAFGFKGTQANVRNQVRLLTAAVKMTFYEAVRERRRSELLAELQALDRRLFDAARSRFEAGEIGQIDLNLSQVRYGESRRALIDGIEAYRLRREISRLQTEVQLNRRLALPNPTVGPLLATSKLMNDSSGCQLASRYHSSTAGRPKGPRLPVVSRKDGKPSAQRN
jgi:outer membrane protein TolC